MVAVAAVAAVAAVVVAVAAAAVVVVVIVVCSHINSHYQVRGKRTGSSVEWTGGNLRGVAYCRVHDDMRCKNFRKGIMPKRQQSQKTSSKQNKANRIPL